MSEMFNKCPVCPEPALEVSPGIWAIGPGLTAIPRTETSKWSSWAGYTWTVATDKGLVTWVFANPIDPLFAYWMAETVDGMGPKGAAVLVGQLGAQGVVDAMMSGKAIPGFGAAKRKALQEALAKAKWIGQFSQSGKAEQEASRAAKALGFAEDRIGEAIQAVKKAGDELTVNQVLNWLRGKAKG